MQNRMEDFIEFLNTIKKEVHEWEFRHLWASRIFVYGGLFLLVIFVGAILFANFNLFRTDVTSARYMLSALVQSQAAIVAIVITLTLIAVQLTASASSPRVIDVFKRIPDMWILLGCYAISIFYGFLILKLVEGAEGEVVSQSAIWTLGPISISFEFCVSLAYWLGAFTFVVLFMYLWNIISLLKPENIIKRLAVEITKDKILKEDPVQPITDIIHGSMMNDLETTRVGLKTVTDQVIKIIGKDDEEMISEYFCVSLKRVSRLAISREDEESTTEVIKNLEYFGTLTAEKGLEDATGQAVGSLADVGEAAADKGLEHATMRAVGSLADVGEAAADKGLEHATMRAVVSLEVVGKTAADKGLEDATRQAARPLEEIGKAAADKGLKHATMRAVMSLAEVGRAAADKGLEDATMRAVMSLADVGKVAADKGLEDATGQAAKSLAYLGKAAAEKGLEDATRQAAESLAELTILNEEIVKTAIQNYESKLEEQDWDSFQKFKKVYEQELEKLRAEK